MGPLVMLMAGGGTCKGPLSMVSKSGGVGSGVVAGEEVDGGVAEGSVAEDPLTLARPTVSGGSTKTTGLDGTGEHLTEFEPRPPCSLMASWKVILETGSISSSESVRCAHSGSSWSGRTSLSAVFPAFDGKKLAACHTPAT